MPSNSTSINNNNYSITPNMERFRTSTGAHLRMPGFALVPTGTTVGYVMPELNPPLIQNFNTNMTNFNPPVLPSLRELANTIPGPPLRRESLLALPSARDTESDSAIKTESDIPIAPPMSYAHILFPSSINVGHNQPSGTSNKPTTLAGSFRLPTPTHVLHVPNPLPEPVPMPYRVLYPRTPHEARLIEFHSNSIARVAGFLDLDDAMAAMQLCESGQLAGNVEKLAKQQLSVIYWLIQEWFKEISDAKSTATVTRANWQNYRPEMFTGSGYSGIQVLNQNNGGYGPSYETTHRPRKMPLGERKYNTNNSNDENSRGRTLHRTPPRSSRRERE